MCGICAKIGNENNIKNVVDGLKKLEYRGYDSSGVAYIEKGTIKCVKSVGQIKNLQQKVDDLSAKIVIGHTRWATHGKVTEDNAHPHLSHSGRFALVHNGIVENFEDLKDKYLKDISLHSQTDTEIFVNLIEKQSGSTLERLISACKMVEGSFAVAMLDKNEKKIFVAKRNSPLMLACDGNSCMAGSDVSVFVEKFEKYYILDDDEFAVLSDGKIDIFDRNAQKTAKKAVFIDNFDFCEDFSNEEYSMLKEIKEQPVVLKKTYFKYFTENILNNEILEKLKKYKKFCFVACGTAYHSCLLGARYIQKFCHKECSTFIASEFRYADNVYDKNCLYVFVSQSGETADTIACAKEVKNNGMKILCVTNVPYCSLNKLADFVLPTFAGKEVAVASTKAYTAQVFTLLILTLKMAGKDFKNELKKFVLNFEPNVFSHDLFEKISKFEKVFFVGRQQDYVTALEGALKLKEIAYLNCVGLASGELKHGTLALIDEKTLVIAISTQKSTQEKLESNIQEIKARGGKVLLISSLLHHNIEVDFQFDLPDFEEFLMPIVSIVPLQDLALNFSLYLGYNPDKPRNLAKSVTVE